MNTLVASMLGLGPHEMGERQDGALSVTTNVGAVGGPTRERRALATRLWSGVLAGWGAFTGLVPHVLHHAGPLAGAALLAGSGGTVLFAAVGVVAAVPFLLRLYRRFDTWRAPAIALAVFALTFSLSSFLIGPAISGDDEPDRPGIEQAHEEHH